MFHEHFQVTANVVSCYLGINGINEVLTYGCCDRCYLNEACIHCFFIFMYMFQPHHALTLAYLMFWALHLEGSWLEYYLLEHCGLSKLKQVNVRITMHSFRLNTDLNWCLSGLKLTFCLIQGTQLDWTLAQLQQIFLVRNFSFISIVSFLLLIILSASLSCFFRMSLLRSKTTTGFHQPFPFWEQQRQR